MPRQLKSKLDASVLQASAQLSLQVGTKKPRKSGAGTPVRRLMRLMEVVDKCVEDDEWPLGEGPVLLVALFCWAHNEIYGVSCTVEVARVFKGAQSAAEKLIRTEFEGSLEKAIEFMRWVWRREREREQWRRRNTGYGKVLTWRHVLMTGELVKEMRLDQLRTKGIP
jgi:hypothetical protein